MTKDEALKTTAVVLPAEEGERPVTTMTSNDGVDCSTGAFQIGLTRKLIQSRQGSNKEQPKRISNEAVLAAGELLRIFVLEARHRAGIVAECEQEAVETSSRVGGEKISIRADHVTKIAAELLLDFS